jgi:hypothetical protein
MSDMKPIDQMTLPEILHNLRMSNFYDELSVHNTCNMQADVADRIHDLTRWTDADVDSAYIMGCINAHSVKVTEGAVFPTLIATQMELERLKSLGFNTPSDAIRALRYPQRITPPEGKP